MWLLQAHPEKLIVHAQRGCTVLAFPRGQDQGGKKYCSMLPKKILIIDDEVAYRNALRKFFGNLGYDVKVVHTGKEALELLSKHTFDLVLTDLRLPDVDGLSLVEKIEQEFSQTSSIVMTGYGSIESSIEAIKKGAFHYITKPFQLEEVKNLVEKALNQQALQNENRGLKEHFRDSYRFDNIIGESAAIQEVFQLVKKVSRSDSTVLILGESGTGKELIARAIHYNSERSNKPLITVNCGAIAETLLESELFGHERGSFTGAIATRAGRFELAHGGSLFLDEISTMNFALQAKLLRVLQSKTFEPVGGTTKNVDARIIAATNQDLEAGVRRKEFREDLFYRLNVIPIHLPALRERKEDIPLLVLHFVAKFNKAKNKGELKIEGVSPETLNTLMEYNWPGNIRELENIMERLMVLKEGGTITPQDLPLKLFQNKKASLFQNVFIPENGIDFKETVDNFENTILASVLKRTQGNRNRAAKLLKLKRTTLIEKLKRKNIKEI